MAATVALATGVNRGIGLGVTRQFARLAFVEGRPLPR